MNWLMAGKVSVLAMFVASGSACRGVLPATHTRTDTFTEAADPVPSLRAATRNGSVRVERAEIGAVEIEATIRARTQERLDATSVIVERLPDALIELRVAWPDDEVLSGEGCSFVVRLPKASLIDLTSSNGALSVIDVGDSLTLNTTNGSIDVQGCEGPIMARTSNGRITLTDIAGEVDATSSNGAIEIAGARSRVDATTTNGRLEVILSDDNVGPVHAKTSNGALTIEVGPAFRGRLNTRTNNGSMRFVGLTPDGDLMIREKSYAIDIGDAAQAEPSTAVTSNGRIEVRRR